MKSLVKIIICFCLVYTPFFANAGAAENWTIEEVVYDNIGKSLSYTAQRPNAIAVNDYVYKAKVGVTAVRTGSTVASMIRMGAAGAAIYGIVEGVGWIIDEAGIVKKEIKGVAPGFQKLYVEAPSYGFTSSRLYSDPNLAISDFLKVYLNTSDFIVIEHAVASTANSAGQKKVTFTSSYKQGTTTKTTRVLIAIYSSDVETTKYVPVSDSELGAAINNSPQAPSVLPDVYNPNNPAGGQASDATDDALNKANPQPRSKPSNDVKNKPNKDTDGDGVPDVYDPELPSEGFEFELFEFCSWAATVCEWYTKYKEDSEKVDEHREKEIEVWGKEETHRTEEKTFFQKVEDWFNWSKQDDVPEKDEDEKLKDDLDVPEITENLLNASGQCPPDLNLLIPDPFGGQHQISFSYSTFCLWLSNLKPWVLLTAHIIGLSILGGRGSKDV